DHRGEALAVGVADPLQGGPHALVRGEIDADALRGGRRVRGPLAVEADHPILFGQTIGRGEPDQAAAAGDQYSAFGCPLAHGCLLYSELCLPRGDVCEPSARRTIASTRRGTYF